MKIPFRVAIRASFKAAALFVSSMSVGAGARL